MRALLLSFVVLTPGSLLTLILFPSRRLAPITCAASSIALGYIAMSSTGLVLARLGILSTTTFWFLWLATCCTAGFILFRRRQEERPALGLAIEDRWLLVLGVIVLAAIAYVRLRHPWVLSVSEASQFRYWSDGVQIAHLGSIPSEVLHWGDLYPPTVSKILANTFIATTTFVIGDDPMRGLATLTLLPAIGLAVTSLAFAWEIGLRYTAPVVPLFLTVSRTFFDEELVGDLARFTVESIGRVLAFAALALAVRALRERRSWVEFGTAGVILGCTAATHLSATIMALIILGAWVVGAGATRRSLRVVSEGAGIASIAIVVGILILVSSKGDIGFQAAIRGPQPSSGETDLTAYFYKLGASDEVISNGRWYTPPGDVYDDFVAASFGTSEAQHALPVALLALAAVVLFIAPRELKPVPVMTIVMSAAIFLLLLYFSFRYQTFIPAMTGSRRVLDYSAVPLILLVLAGAEIGIGKVAARNSALARGVAAVAIVGILLVMLPAALPDDTSRIKAPLSLSPMAWIAENAPCDARILATQRTAGSWEALTGRAAISEGMSPYLRPEMLDEVVEKVREIQGFLRDPASDADLLIRENVDYLVLGRPIAGSSGPIALPPPGIDELPFVAKVFEQGRISIYEVTAPRSAETAQPRLVGAPCRTGVELASGRLGRRYEP